MPGNKRNRRWRRDFPAAVFYVMKISQNCPEFHVNKNNKNPDVVL